MDCSADTNSITITFSEAVDQNITDTGAANPDNYTIYNPAAAGFTKPKPPIPAANWQLTFPDKRTVLLSWTGTTPATIFHPGDFVLVGVSNIALVSSPGIPALIDDPTTVVAQVPGKGATGRITKDVEDAIAYPILTEDVRYRPSPTAFPSGGGGIAGAPSTSGLGQIALSTVSDVLGWKANTTDPKGFIGALTQSFTLTDVEGHTESKWMPRTYAVQTDLGGGITGAQASLYMRAKDALDTCLPLLDGLYPLDPEADPEYVKALREMARSQMTEIVKEMGVVGLPSILRINTYFGILLGQTGKNGETIVFDPDAIHGTLGQLRDTYGIYFRGNEFSNSVEDEQDITNFRVISDYLTSLLQSWVANRSFFVIAPGNEAFFGTQLVLISRQFSVIVETVNEVRFTLDSVFIGPAERQTLLLKFVDGTPPMYLEDVLEEIESFASNEGPRLLRDGGRISVTNNILPVVQSLQNLVEQAHHPSNINQLPDGLRTARVRNSLDDLQDQLEALIQLTQQVEQNVPSAEDKLAISSLSIPSGGHTTAGLGLTLIGNGIDPYVQVKIHSTHPIVISSQQITFYSSQRVDVTIPGTLESGPHDLTLTNPDGQTVTLFDAFTFDGQGIKLGKQKAMNRAATGATQTASSTAQKTVSTPVAMPAPVTTPPTSPLEGRIDTIEEILRKTLALHHNLKEGQERVLEALEKIESRVHKLEQHSANDKIHDPSASKDKTKMAKAG